MSSLTKMYHTPSSIRFFGGVDVHTFCVRLHRPLQEGWMATVAKVSHALFYILLILMPILGLLAYYVGDPYDDLHELGKPILIILIALHACGSLFHQFWLKDGTLRGIFVPRS
jgi:cytochrome b561